MTGFMSHRIDVTKQKICYIRPQNRPENTLIVRGLNI